MGDKIHRNSLKPGHKLHWYRIEKILGQGGFGITYLAHDFNLDRQVAIKEYLPIELAVREGDFSIHPVSEDHGEKFRWGRDRFITEARTLAKFKHPNIVHVLNVFEANNTAYMVMEYEQGESLQDILSRRKTLEEAELINILIPVLGGLQKVHEAGFIHRDIKPANIFIRMDGSPVLLDFGSARQALGIATQTLTSLVSPGYAPYEQYYSKSDQQGPWTDIYG
jgi:Serine/threonine protein kinase